MYIFNINDYFPSPTALPLTPIDTPPHPTPPHTHKTNRTLGNSAIEICHKIFAMIQAIYCYDKKKYCNYRYNGYVYVYDDINEVIYFFLA